MDYSKVSALSRSHMQHLYGRTPKQFFSLILGRCKENNNLRQFLLGGKQEIWNVRELAYLLDRPDLLALFKASPIFPYIKSRTRLGLVPCFEKDPEPGSISDIVSKANNEEPVRYERMLPASPYADCLFSRMNAVCVYIGDDPDFPATTRNMKRREAKDLYFSNIDWDHRLHIASIYDAYGLPNTVVHSPSGYYQPKFIPLEIEDGWFAGKELVRSPPKSDVELRLELLEEKLDAFIDATVNEINTISKQLKLDK